MKGDPGKIDKVTKVQGVNFALMIRQKITTLRRLVKKEKQPILSNEALDDFKALFSITLNSIEDWNYQLICTSLGFAYSESQSKINKEINAKWFNTKGSFDYELYLIALGNICAHSDFEIDEVDYRMIENSINRFQGLYVSSSLERFLPASCQADRDIRASVLRETIKSNLGASNDMRSRMIKMYEEKLGPI